jgi:hypothetical protein
MIVMFVAGAAVVTLFVIVRRFARSRNENPARRRILE